MPVLKVKGMRRWCSAVSISSCLSLISILRGNVARLCRLNRCVSLGGDKVVCFSFFFWERGRFEEFRVNVSGFWVGSGYCNAIFCQPVGRPAPLRRGCSPRFPYLFVSHLCHHLRAPTLSLPLALYFLFRLLLNKPPKK